MKDAEWNKIALVILLLGGIFGGTWNLTLFINNQSHISKDNNHHNTSDQMNKKLSYKYQSKDFNN